MNDAPVKGRSTDSELLEVVDERDRVIGMDTRRRIHEKHLLHRAVHVFLFDSRGRLYLQRRSDYKDRFPGLLDSSAAGHVDPGEAYEQAARRELKEELDIDAHVVEITRVTPSEITDFEHVALYRAQSDAKPHPDPGEVQWGAFFEPTEVDRLIEKAPDDFVPIAVHLWNHYKRQNQ